MNYFWIPVWQDEYLDVSRRSFRRIDFRLTDAYGKNYEFKQFSLVSDYNISETQRQYMYEMTWCGTFRSSFIYHTQTHQRW